MHSRDPREPWRRGSLQDKETNKGKRYEARLIISITVERKKIKVGDTSPQFFIQHASLLCFFLLQHKELNNTHHTTSHIWVFRGVAEEETTTISITHPHGHLHHPLTITLQSLLLLRRKQPLTPHTAPAMSLAHLSPIPPTMSILLWVALTTNLSMGGPHLAFLLPLLLLPPLPHLPMLTIKLPRRSGTMSMFTKTRCASSLMTTTLTTTSFLSFSMLSMMEGKGFFFFTPPPHPFYLNFAFL